MRRQLLPLALCLALLPGGCATSADKPAPAPSPPLIPAIAPDIETCDPALSSIPDRDLSEAETELLWKIDRAAAAKAKRCLYRLKCQVKKTRREIGKVASQAICPKTDPAPKR